MRRRRLCWPSRAPGGARRGRAPCTRRSVASRSRTPPPVAGLPRLARPAGRSRALSHLVSPEEPPPEPLVEHLDGDVQVLGLRGVEDRHLELAPHVAQVGLDEPHAVVEGEYGDVHEREVVLPLGPALYPGEGELVEELPHGGRLLLLEALEAGHHLHY